MEREELVITLIAEVDEAKQKLEGALSSLDGYRNKIAEVEKVSGKLRGTSDKAAAGIDKQAKAVKNTTGRLKEMQQTLRGIGDTIGGVKSMFTMGLGAIAFDRLMNLNRDVVAVGNTSLSTGVSAEKVQALRNLSARSGFDEGEADSLLKNIQGGIDAMQFRGDDSIKRRMGILPVDLHRNGKFREASDVIVDMGEKALEIAKGNTQQAIALLQQAGLTEKQAILITQDGFAERWRLAQKETTLNNDRVKSAREAIESLQKLKETGTTVLLELLNVLNPILKAIANFLRVPVRGEKPKDFNPNDDKINKFFRWLEGDEPATEKASSKPSTTEKVSNKPSSDTATVGDATRTVLDTIAKGEGHYNSVNLGKKGGYRASTRDLTNMTIGEVLAAQDRKEFNAAGRYQFIPSTLRSAMKQAGLSENDMFDAVNQDKLGLATLMSRKPIRDFVEGRSNNGFAAIRAGAQEWASIADPETGRSYYDKVGNNKASISSQEFLNALIAMRNANATSQNSNVNTTVNNTIVVRDANELQAAVRGTAQQKPKMTGRANSAMAV